MHAKKYGAIICEDLVKWGTAEEIGTNFINAFKDHNSEEHWEYFSACKGVIPDINKVDEYQGFIVSGSHYSANEELDWMIKLEEFFKGLYEHHKGGSKTPKLFGACFGHQIINKALGAKVAKNHGGRFIFKKVDIKPTSELCDQPYYKTTFGDRRNVTLFQSHGEEVIDLPNWAQLVASSDNCKNEAVYYGDNILTFQGHMELKEEHMLERILPAIKNAGLFNEEDENEMRSCLEKNNDKSGVVKLIRGFIDQ